MKMKIYLYCFLIFQIIAFVLYSYIYFGAAPILFKEYNKFGQHSGQVYLTEELYKAGIKIPEKYEVYPNKHMSAGLSIKEFTVFKVPYYITIVFHILSFVFFFLYIILKNSTNKNAARDASHP